MDAGNILRYVKQPWHQFGLPCLIRSHFWFWVWGQVVLEPEQHPKNIHVRTSVASAATTFDLDAVEVTCGPGVWYLSLS